MSERFKRMGAFFGYPECCIEAMVEHNKKVGPNFASAMDEKHTKPSPFSGTGYVPCDECWYKPPSDMINIIKSRRYHKLDSFPSEKQYGMDHPLFIEFVRAKNYV